MNKLTCIAIDDEPLALSVIKSYAMQTPTLSLLQTFDDAIAAKAYLEQHPVDLLFIDINMPDITGIDFVKNISEKPLIIFTTAHKNYAIDGFDLDAADYLLKPISLDRFSKAVQKAIDLKTIQLSKSQGQDYLFVRSEHKNIKIILEDIEYIEALGDYIKIYLHNAKPVMTLMALSKIQEKLPSSQFARTHRSYIIHQKKVAVLSNKKIILQSGAEIPVGEKFVESTQHIIQNKIAR